MARGAFHPELREPLADLLDALELWEWVGSDTAMDEWVRATAKLREAGRALRDAVGRVLDAPA